MLLPLGVQQEINVNGSPAHHLLPERRSHRQALPPDHRPRPPPRSRRLLSQRPLQPLPRRHPRVSVDAGTLYEGHDGAWGVAKEKDFNDNHYHNVSDNFDPTWDFTGDANLARFGIDLGWQVLNAPHPIEWNKGDEFAPARQASKTSH